jgi:hypothetical protein
MTIQVILEKEDMQHQGLDRRSRTGFCVVRVFYWYIQSNAMLDAYTDFSNPIMDDTDFLKHLHEKGFQNIPNEINNKQQLDSLPGR